jgi:hypothetical protein
VGIAEGRVGDEGRFYRRPLRELFAPSSSSSWRVPAGRLQAIVGGRSAAEGFRRFVAFGVRIAKTMTFQGN